MQKTPRTMAFAKNPSRTVGKTGSKRRLAGQLDLAPAAPADGNRYRDRNLCRVAKRCTVGVRRQERNTPACETFEGSHDA
jgi:hypothetical protein